MIQNKNKSEQALKDEIIEQAVLIDGYAVDNEAKTLMPQSDNRSNVVMFYSREGLS